MDTDVLEANRTSSLTFQQPFTLSERMPKVTLDLFPLYRFFSHHGSVLLPFFFPFLSLSPLSSFFFCATRFKNSRSVVKGRNDTVTVEQVSLRVERNQTISATRSSFLSVFNRSELINGAVMRSLMLRPLCICVCVCIYVRARACNPETLWPTKFSRSSLN